VVGLDLEGGEGLGDAEFLGVELGDAGGVRGGGVGLEGFLVVVLEGV
jgi:hypothetical protein